MRTAIIESIDVSFINSPQHGDARRYTIVEGTRYLGWVPTSNNPEAYGRIITMRDHGPGLMGGLTQWTVEAVALNRWAAFGTDFEAFLTVLPDKPIALVLRV